MARAPSQGNKADSSIKGRFVELLTPLRFHLFDSHIAAWGDASNDQNLWMALGRVT